MTAVYNMKPSGSACPTTDLDAGGVRLSIRSDNMTTVVAATGEVDASNIDRVSEYLRTALTVNHPLVVDLRELTFFGAQGIPALFSLGEHCAKAGVDWVIVVSHPVLRLLRIGDKDHRLPTVSSMPEAMKRLTGVTPARRLLQLVAQSG
jgi:anti-anti-sigma factor